MDYLRELGYEPSYQPADEERGAGAVEVAFILWIAQQIGAAAVTELAQGVAAWIRKHLPRRPRGGGTVRVIYGPHDEVLAEVLIDNNRGTSR